MTNCPTLQAKVTRVDFVIWMCYEVQLIDADCIVSERSLVFKHSLRKYPNVLTAVGLISCSHGLQMQALQDQSVTIVDHYLFPLPVA